MSNLCARSSSRAERWESGRKSQVPKAVAHAMRESDRRTNHQVLGAVLLAIGGNWLLAELGLFPFGWPGLLAAGLMTLGIAMIGTAKSGRTAPLVAIGVLMTVLLAMSSGVSGALGGRNFGAPHYTPASAAEIRSDYSLGAGELTLDLRNTHFEVGIKSVDIEVGVGEILVILPSASDVAVDIAAEVGLGEIALLDRVSDDGVGLEAPYRDSNWASHAQRLDLDLRVGGVGDIKVVRP